MGNATQIPVKLTLTEVRHLLNLLYNNIRDGSYYGNKKQYDNRHTRLISVFSLAEVFLTCEYADDRQTPKS